MHTEHEIRLQKVLGHMPLQLLVETVVEEAMGGRLFDKIFNMHQIGSVQAIVGLI